MVAKSGVWDGGKWKFAPALLHLVEQLDKACPDRSKKSDGSIASHQHYENNPHSDHDPHFYKHEGNIVTALDITHDTEKGVNCAYLWDSLLASKDHRIKYVIFNHRIFNDERFVADTTGAKRRGPWNPGEYDGADPHTGHLHISVWGDTAGNVMDWAMPEWFTSPERQAYVKRLGAAAKRVDATDPPPRTAAEHSAAVRAEAVNPKLVEKAVLAMLGDDATSNSLRYLLRFYRQLAKRIGFDGGKPEDVANWIYSQIQSAQLGIHDLTEQKADG